MAATAHVSRMIPAQPEEVWKALTSREGMRAYMMGADVETDWRIGSPITMRGEIDGRRFEDRGEIRSFLPERRLSYTHVSGSAPDNPHLVTFELWPHDGGTEVMVTQQNLDGRVTPGDLEHRSQYQKTWAAMLEKLENVVSH